MGTQSSTPQTPQMGHLLSRGHDYNDPAPFVRVANVVVGIVDAPATQDEHVIPARRAIAGWDVSEKTLAPSAPT